LRPHRVLLTGGIGNQLFQYAAGKWVEKINEAPVVFDARLLIIEKPHEGFLTDLGLPGTFQVSKSKVSYQYLMASAERILRNRIFPALDLVLSLLRIDNPKKRKKPLGYDPHLEAIQPGRRLDGYFQTYVFAQEVLPQLKRDLNIKQPSSWFLNEIKMMETNRVVAIHVRRGDYEKHRHTFGLLGAEYYRDALSTLKDLGHSWEEIWVFSDDVAKARELLSPLNLAEIRYVEPASGANPVESLLLFSRASLGIIANSTFSWWACFLAKDMADVVAPSKWFKDKEDPEKLVPANWLIAKSSWE
jgi:hypothetical protein